MCTATYLPGSPTSFVLTHSRDEKALRPPAHPPRTVPIGGQDVTFPQDPQGQGTWIAMTTDLTVCLLNGAFVAHTPQPPYRHSRGLVVLDAFDYVSIDSFIHQYPFAGIEPFTLLLAETDRLAGQRLVELRWTGGRLFISEKDARLPHIWSSVTLYTPDVIRQREGWFKTWLQCNPAPTVADIRHFHQSAGAGDPTNSLRMNRRNALLTVSLTSVVHPGENVGGRSVHCRSADRMLYEDLTQNRLHQPVTRPAYATA